MNELLQRGWLERVEKDVAKEVSRWPDEMKNQACIVHTNRRSALLVASSNGPSKIEKVTKKPK